jgi:hypothetical protein
MYRQLSREETKGITHLLDVAVAYLSHPDVEVAGGPEKCRAVAEKLRSSSKYLRSSRIGLPLLDSYDARRMSSAVQEAADLLSHPGVGKIPFSLPASNVARELRNVVARLKEIRS